MDWKWPWPRRRETLGVRAEQKSGAGFIAFHAQGDARWTRRDYAALAREGFMKNPVAHDRGGRGRGSRSALRRREGI